MIILIYKVSVAKKRWKRWGNEKFRSFALTVNASLLVIHILVVEVEDADGHVVGLLSGTFRVAGDGL